MLTAQGGVNTGNTGNGGMKNTFFSSFLGKGGKKPGKGAPQKKENEALKQIGNLAFNWELHKSISPLKDFGLLLVRTLALVMMQAGLLPRDYPGIFDNQRPKFVGVLRDAYRNIVWRKENALQIAFYFSIVGFLVCTIVMAILGAISFVMINTSHAQGFFTNNNDLGKRFIDYIFLAQNPGGGFGNMSGLSEGMRWMFGFYSKAMLVFAAVILLYLLVGIVAETAHEGVTLGKRANQIWAPIRLVVAIGLLVPVGDTLSSGQAIVIQMARWGSQMASNIWDTFLAHYSYAGSVSVSRSQFVDLTPQTYTMTVNFICMYAWNKHVGESSQGDKVQRIGVLSGYDLSTPNAADGRICGAMRTTGSIGLISMAAMESQAEMLADEIVKANTMQDLANRPDIQALLGMVRVLFSMSGRNMTVSSSGASGGGGSYGWVGAGGYFMNLTVGITSSMASVNGSMPVYYGPHLMQTQLSRSGLTDQALLDKIKFYFDKAKTMFDTLISRSAVNLAPFSALSGGLVSDAGRTMIDMLFMLIDTALSLTGVWTYGPVAQLAVWIDSSVNPLAAFILFGFAWAQGCLELIGWGLSLQSGASGGGQIMSLGVPLLGGLLMGSAQTMKALGSLIALVGTIGLISGIMISFMVPLQCFIKFLFTTLTWLLSVFEAVLAVPLIAIAHLNPEGNGLPGQNARQAYFLLVNMFVRPALMLFGLCFGLMLFTIGAGLINMLFYQAGAISFSAANGSGFAAFAILTKVAMTTIYLTMFYILSNSCWKPIDFFPTQALRWIGQQSAQMDTFGDANQVQQVLQTGSLFFGSQIVSQAGGLVGGGGDGGGGVGPGQAAALIKGNGIR